MVHVIYIYISHCEPKHREASKQNPRCSLRSTSWSSSDCLWAGQTWLGWVGQWRGVLRKTVCLRWFPFPGLNIQKSRSSIRFVASRVEKPTCLGKNHWASFKWLLQEPVLVWPESFMGLMIEIPRVPRPLRTYDLERCKKFMQLAQLLLEVAQTASTERTVNYLIKLCQQDPDVDPVPEFGWLSRREPGMFDELAAFEPNRSRPLAALMPQMRFTARLGRQWKKSIRSCESPQKLGQY